MNDDLLERNQKIFDDFMNYKIIDVSLKYHLSETAIYNIVRMHSMYKLKKQIGDIKCKEIECLKCPVRMLCKKKEKDSSPLFLTYVKEKNKIKYIDEEIHKLICDRLMREK